MGILKDKIKDNISEIALGAVVLASAGIITWSFVSNATNVNANNSGVTEQTTVTQEVQDLDLSGVPAGMYISSTGDIGFLDMGGNFIEE